jgi:hypothetical protein
MSTNPIDLLYADLAAVLQGLCPQTRGMARHEHVTPLLQHSAREMATNAQLAVDELGPQHARRFARALRAVGQQHVAVAERIDELAAEAQAASARVPDTAGLRPSSREDS